MRFTKNSFNIKAQIAKARKLAAEENREKREALRREDKNWLEFEKPKSSCAVKAHQERAEKRVLAAARKAENRRLVEQEIQELQKLEEKKKKKKTVSKVTEAERRRVAQLLTKAREESKRRIQNRCVTEDEYKRMVSVKNNNHDDSVIEANTIEGAIAALTLGSKDILAMPVGKNNGHNNRAYGSHKERKNNAISTAKKKSKSLKYLDEVDFVEKDFPLSDFDEDEDEDEDEEDDYKKFKYEYRPYVLSEEYFKYLIKV